jgi:UDP-xylose/UDP-N-acetylglucosamine transporter B4
MYQALTSNPYTATWLFGISLMVLTVTMAAFLGQLQKVVADSIGRAPTESIFYSHLLPLVAVWVGMGSSLRTQLGVWGTSPACVEALQSLPVLGHTLELGWLWQLLPAAAGRLPVMYAVVTINIFSQWMCINGVYRLTAYADPLTSNIVMTVRKFISLLISVVLFGNTFTAYHWVAAVLVFSSVLWYSTAPQPTVAGKKKVD